MPYDSITCLAYGLLSLVLGFHFTNPFFYLASPVIQVKLEEQHADGLLDFALVEATTGFVCVWIYLWWYGSIGYEIDGIWYSCFWTEFDKHVISLWTSMPCCPLLKNNCFHHPSVLETTRISTDSIPQCNSFYCASCKNWWTGGLFCIKFTFRALPLEKTIFLGPRKAQSSLYSLDL